MINKFVDSLLFSEHFNQFSANKEQHKRDAVQDKKLKELVDRKTRAHLG
jgi:hypothetical protein